MKHLFTSLIIFVLLFSASCTMTEDITPPPTHPSPSPTVPIPQAAATVTPTPTRIPPTKTVAPDETPISISPANSTGEPTFIPEAFIGNISGFLVTPAGSQMPEGQMVLLVGYDMDPSGSYRKVLQVETNVNADSSYLFRDIEVPLGRAFLIFTTWEDVEYQSDPLIVSAVTNDFSLPLTVYQKTENWDGLTFEQVHLIFGAPDQESIRVTGLFVVSNTGEQAVFVPTDGTTVPFIRLPETASNLKFQLSQNSSELLNASGGFAMLPGAEKQYGFLASFNMPYKRSLEYLEVFSLPVSSLTVFVPQGMRLRSKQLTEEGLQVIQDQTYQLYQSTGMAAESSISGKLSGTPDDGTGSLSERQKLVVIGIGVVGLLLIGVGVFFYFYDRSRAKKNENGTDVPAETGPSDADREAIMDAIIDLDDQYKAGAVPGEEYEIRRKELKERLQGNLPSSQS